MARVRADKLREAHAGHDGTWVAHPGLAPMAREAFDARDAGPEPARACRARTSTVTAADLLQAPEGEITEGGPARLHPRRRAVPRGLAARPRLRAALPPDGRRGHRRDLPRAAVAVAARTARAPATAARSRVARFDGLLTAELDRIHARGRRRAPDSAACSRPRRALFEQMTKRDELRRVPDPARLRAAELIRRRPMCDAIHELLRQSLPTAEELKRRLERQPALARRAARLRAPRTSCACAAPLPSSIRSRAPRRREAVALPAGEAVRQRARRADRQPGDAAGQGRARCDLPVRLAGGRRCQPRRRDVSGPVAVSGRLGAGGGAAHQQHAAARRRDPPCRGRRLDRLAQADRGGCRGRLRRRAQRLRADEADDRRRRRRRALRGPAVLGQEVRSHGRQGAGADPGCDQQAGRRAPGGGRVQRAHGAGGAHRRRGAPTCSPRTSTSATGRSSMPPRAAPRKASSASRPAWTRRSRAASPTRRSRTWCGARPPSRTSTRRAQFAEAHPRAVPRQAAGLQLLAVASTGSASSTTRTIAQVPARAGRDGLPASSSSRWPASTRSTTRCSSSRAATRRSR